MRVFQINYQVSIVLIFFAGSVKGQADHAGQLFTAAEAFLAGGNLDSAVTYLDKRAQYLLSAQRTAEYITAYVEIADLFVQVENYTAALHWLDKVAADTLDAGREEVRTSLIEWYLYKAFVNERSGDYVAAKKFYEKVNLELVKPGDEIPLMLGRYLYQPLGNIYARLGEYEQALLFLERFKQLSLQSNNSDESAEAFNDISIIHRTLGDTRKSIGLYKEALALPALSHRARGLLLSNLSSALLDRKEWREALVTATQALKHFQQYPGAPADLQAYKAWTYGTLAHAYAEAGSLHEALEAVQTALAQAGKIYGGRVSREMAKLHVLKASILERNGQPRQALNEFQQALTCLFAGFNNPDPGVNPDEKLLWPENAIIEALHGKATVFYHQYETEKEHAIASLEKSLACYELIFVVEDLIAREYNYQLSRLRLLQERNQRSREAMDICFTLFRLTADNRYIEQAFHIMERNKATVLLQSISEVKAKASARIPDDLLKKEQAGKQAVARYRRLLAHAENTHYDSVWKERLFREEQALKRIRRELTDTYPAYARWLDQEMSLVSLAEAAAGVPGGHTALVEFFFSDRHLYVLRIRDGQTVFRQVTLPEIFFTDVEDYLKWLRKPLPSPEESARATALAGTMYRQLLQPVLEDGALPEHLVIVPDGILMYLPFETLLTGEASHTQKSRPYLLKKTAVSYSFSATVRAKEAGPVRHVPQKDFIGFAPGFTASSGLAQLPYSVDEVAKIGKLFQGKTLSGPDASRANFLAHAGDYRIVHLSTHAAVETANGLYSWIAFADEGKHQPDSFKLYLSEIYALQLPAELVVLSACETGTGFLSEGEGIMSLARGFAFAGCPGTLSTRWLVNDRVTAQIDVAFYRYLAEGWPKDEALRKAKLAYLSGDDVDAIGLHPYYWSSMMLIGDTSPLVLNDPFAWWWLAGGIVFFLALVVVLKKVRSNAR